MSATGVTGYPDELDNFPRTAQIQRLNKPKLPSLSFPGNWHSRTIVLDFQLHAQVDGEWKPIIGRYIERLISWNLADICQYFIPCEKSISEDFENYLFQVNIRSNVVDPDLLSSQVDSKKAI